MYIEIAVCGILLCSHGAALYPAFRALRNGYHPSVIDCAIASVVLYYDLGLVATILGVHTSDHYFTPFFDDGPSELTWSIVILAITPWLMKVGGLVAGGRRIKAGRKSYLVANRVILFFFFSTLVLAVCFYIGFLSAPTGSIWETRTAMAGKLGPYVIALYCPMYILMFFVQLREAGSFGGTCYAILLVAVAIACTIFLGERTLILMPLLAFFLFRSRISIKRFLIVSILALVTAAALLPLFKWQFASEESFLELAQSTIVSDFDRAPILAETVKRSPLFGTDVLPYPGEGYVYSALFFVPRQIARFKGNATAQVFTALESNNTVDETDWGFGISAIDELLLNFGRVLVLPGIILYGIALGFLDRLSTRAGTTLVPTRLFGIWIMGYQLPALLLLFGGMIVFALGLHSLFARSEGSIVHQPKSRRGSSPDNRNDRKGRTRVQPASLLTS